ncbi:hypothetical protein DFH09DRAFT_1088673 [Mycena vulgaris]|nr:hypothetical protein DFH09DRAFT_1088673 [Mycena vulgaris]
MSAPQPLPRRPLLRLARHRAPEIRRWGGCVLGLRSSFVGDCGREEEEGGEAETGTSIAVAIQSRTLAASEADRYFSFDGIERGLSLKLSVLWLTPMTQSSAISAIAFKN